MRLHRSLPLLAAAALLLAGCGGQSGPTTAENNALHAIAHAKKVLSYPIAAQALLAYLPASLRQNIGQPAYIFAVSLKGKTKPAWVVAGPQNAHTLTVYKDIAALGDHVAAFSLGRSGEAALKLIAASKTGTIALSVLGVRVHRATQAQLKKQGVKVGPGTYTVVSLLSPPSALHSPHADVANFVEANGKVLVEYGTNR